MITGGCHCSNIRFRLESAKPPSEFAPRVCDCTFCTKHGARYISDPEAFTTPATVVGYDGEEVDRRLARRQRNWIGTVVIACG